MGIGNAINRSKRFRKGKIMGDVVEGLLKEFTRQREAANAANEKRYAQGLELYSRAEERYGEGGTFLAATEAQLARGGKKFVAAGTQALVSAGLSGTTEVAGLQKRFEEEVGAPTRLQAADIAQQRLTEAESAKAGFIERRDDVGPSFADISALTTQIGQGQAARGRAVPSIRGGSGFDELSRLQRESSARGAASQAASNLRYAQQRSDRDARALASDRRLEALQAKKREAKKPRLDIKFASPIIGKTSGSSSFATTSKPSPKPTPSSTRNTVAFSRLGMSPQPF